MWKAGLHQRAVLWPRLATDAEGQSTFDDPQEIPVRWESRRRAALDPQGNTIILEADVDVSCIVEPFSLLWLGRLRDWENALEYGEVSNLMEVISTDDTPDINGSTRDVSRTLSVAHYRGVPPTGV